MIITDYHVKKVLRTYARQLQKAKLPSEQVLKTEGNETSPLAAGEKVVISEEARRRLVMEQLSKHAVSRIEKEKDLNGDGKNEKVTVDESVENGRIEDQKTESMG